ncbi:hypothetical protein BVRB_8g183070 [Beta vulgaris subsp. vulgaris]|nr:hypothetical protein BVRB_8g183070 [Beta vulgaris subsp. vulgaris]
MSQYLLCDLASCYLSLGFLGFVVYRCFLNELLEFGVILFTFPLNLFVSFINGLTELRRAIGIPLYSIWISCALMPTWLRSCADFVA